MARGTSHNFVFLVWRLKGISGVSEGNGAEFEGAEGKIEVGRVHRENTKITGS